MRRAAYWAAVLFIFTVPWEVAIRVGAVGRVSRAVGLLVAGLWALSVIMRGHSRPLDRFVKAYFLLVLWSGLTMFWTIDVHATLGGFITYVQILGMVLVVLDLFETERRVETALQAFVLGAYVSCVSIFVNWVNAPPTDFPEHQRIKALGFEVDGIALIIAVALPAAWYLATGPPADRLPRVLVVADIAYVPAGVFALVLTGTRGAAVASLPTVVFVAWTLRHARRNRRLAAWAMVGAAIVGVAFLVPREPLQRITGTVSDVVGSDSLSGRKEIWQEGVDIFLTHPVGGVGLDAHRAAVSAGKEAHNTALSVLVETGIVGFVLLVAVIAGVAVRVRQRRGWAAWYWGAQLTAILLGAMSLSLEDRKAVWIMGSLAVASATAARRREDARPPPSDLDLAHVDDVDGGYAVVRSAAPVPSIPS